MTYAVVPALRNNPELAAVYEPLLDQPRATTPNSRCPPRRCGITAGMSMTEKQGGSDVRAGTTQATPNGDGSYSLTGHKWFTSAPMCDVFLVLAQAPGGLICFFLPRILPDGSRNRMFLQRLKDKLGNHANASQRGRVRQRHRAGWSARRAAACRPSSRWSTSPGWTARWAAPPACAAA